ncbi:MAG: thiamine pyrophosphate-dependent enzyme [Desulfomicrobiaceae bacterium]|jgi:2-oxoglutarate ferredoxin oxidoreductase subunit beta
MLDTTIYGAFPTSWCPGCGNHDILAALKTALARLELAPHQFALVSGIGQAAKAPHYLRCNGFAGLHGRALPAAQALKLVQPELTVLVESGDGCTYGEGGNHFLAAIRRNVDITLLVHDNQIYGLTKGQSSPTTMVGHKTKNQPLGVLDMPFNPVAVAVAMGCSFVARSFSGLKEHLAETIVQAVRHPGFALVDIMSPCISFNKVNTFAWYKARCQEIPASHDPTDQEAAMRLAWEFGERIPVGVLFKRPSTPKDQMLPVCQQGPRYRHKPDPAVLSRLMAAFA